MKTLKDNQLEQLSAGKIVIIARYNPNTGVYTPNQTAYERIAAAAQKNSKGPFLENLGTSFVAVGHPSGRY